MTIIIRSNGRKEGRKVKSPGRDRKRRGLVHRGLAECTTGTPNRGRLSVAAHNGA